MKEARSGVQTFIKSENKFLYNAHFICHLADLTTKAGMKSFPVDIYQLFIDVLYHF